MLFACWSDVTDSLLGGWVGGYAYDCGKKWEEEEGVVHLMVLMLMLDSYGAVWVLVGE